MGTEFAPEVGSWYRRLDQSQAFQVVALDKDDGTIDVEYFDGTVDEWPLGHWYELDIEPSGAPADASGALDDFEEELADGSDRVEEDLRIQFHLTPRASARP